MAIFGGVLFAITQIVKQGLNSQNWYGPKVYGIRFGNMKHIYRRYQAILSGTSKSETIFAIWGAN